MPDKKTDYTFWVGMTSVALLAAAIVLCTIAVIEQSWRLGVGAIGGYLAAQLVVGMVASALRKRVELNAQLEADRQAFADEVRTKQGDLVKTLAEPHEVARMRAQCQKPVYNGGLGSPEPCADREGHDGPCTP
jgi:ribulose 1,5-bisphosphate synthetase/thiazole synthase